MTQNIQIINKLETNATKQQNETTHRNTATIQATAKPNHSQIETTSYKSYNKCYTQKHTHHTHIETTHTRN